MVYRCGSGQLKRRIHTPTQGAGNELACFLDALDEAGDDPVARAEAFYHLHLDSYPFWLGETRESEEGEAEPFEPLV